MLFVVATPLGNIQDITDRAKTLLGSVDVVLCEDTRVTGKLCMLLGITPHALWTFHEHTSDAVRADMVHALLAGKTMALVTDAGTPGISDPGGKLVADAVRAGVAVFPVPGASAVTAALSVCGFPTARFTFLGFPPQKKGRTAFFAEVLAIPHVVVLYESPYRIVKTLEHFVGTGRLLCVGREVTKLHETWYRGTAEEVLVHLAQTSGKGEFVVVVGVK